MGQCSIWVRHSLKRTVTGVQATGELSDLQRAQSVSSWVADTWAVRLHFSDGTNTSVESRNFKDVLVFFFCTQARIKDSKHPSSGAERDLFSNFSEATCL